MKVASSAKDLNADLAKPKAVRRASAGGRAQRPTGRLEPVPIVHNRKASRKMVADRPVTFLLKGKKQTPEPPKQKRAEELKTNEAQDEAIDLQKILAYYRERVQAHELDRQQYLAKMEKLRIKADVAHKTEWELKKRTEEMTEIEEALRHCQAQLGNERGTIQEMSEGQDRLKAK